MNPITRLLPGGFTLQGRSVSRKRKTADTMRRKLLARFSHLRASTILLVALVTIGMQLQESLGQEVEFSFSGSLDGGYEGQTYALSYRVNSSRLGGGLGYGADGCGLSSNCVQGGQTSPYPVTRIFGRIADIRFDLREGIALPNGAPGSLGPSFVQIADDFEDEGDIVRDTFLIQADLSVFPEGEQSTFLLTSASTLLESNLSVGNRPSTSLDDAIASSLGVGFPSLGALTLDPEFFQAASTSFRLLEVTMPSPSVFVGGDSTTVVGTIDVATIRVVPEPSSALLGVLAVVGLLTAVRRRFYTTRDSLMAIVATLVLIVAGPSTQASAAVNVTAYEVGDSVVFDGSGAFEPSGLSYVVTAFSSGSLVRANPAEVMLGGVDTVGIDVYGSTAGRFLVRPANLGESTSTLFAGSSFGDRFGVTVGFADPSESFLNVPEGYLWGAPLSGSMTFSGTTLQDLGLAHGEYTWFVDGYGGPIEMLTLRVVPEPSTLVLGALSVAALGLRWTSRSPREGKKL